MNNRKILTLPNYLCLLRLMLAPVLLLLAWYGRHDIFIPVLILAFLLDAVDGPIARRFHQESELGPHLDTTADVAIYLTLPVSAWWLWPGLIQREFLYVLVIVASILVPALAGLIRFRQPTSYHTWMVKFAAVVTAVSTLVLLTGGPALPFRVASFVCLAAGMEEVLITLVLSGPRSDVRSLLYVIRKSRK